MWQQRLICQGPKSILRVQRGSGPVHGVRIGAPARSRLGVCGAKLNQVEPAAVVVDGEVAEFPACAGVYAVYDGEDNLQYVGLSRKVCKSW